MVIFFVSISNYNNLTEMILCILQLVDVYRLVESDIDLLSVAMEVVRGKFH